MPRPVIRAGLAALALGACDGLPPPPAIDAVVPRDARIDPKDYVVVAAVPATPNRLLDVLFVVDDSSGMATRQAALAAAMPAFLARLATAPGGLPDLHVGVVTSDLGTSSTDAPPAPATGACSGTGRAGKLVAPFVTSATPALAAALGAMVQVGEVGCAFAQHLAAMRAALDGRNAESAGLVRPSANLMIAIVADGDDCSAKSAALFAAPDTFRCFQAGVRCAVGGSTEAARALPGPKDYCEPDPDSLEVDDVAPYRDFLVALKPDAKVIVGAIIGPPAPVAVELRGDPAVPAVAHACGLADPGIRFARLLDGFAATSTAGSICAPDLAGSVAQLAQVALQAIGTPCLDRAVADVDPAVGLQADCIVEDIAGASVARLPGCDAMLTPTCWRLVDDPATCPVNHARLVIERGGVAPDPATITRARCRT